MYRAQAQEPASARARATARGGDRRLYRHDLATTPKDNGNHQKTLHRKSGRAPLPRLRLPRVLEEVGVRLFTFVGLPPSQWRSARTTNAIERLHEDFKRRIKAQTVLPSADTAAILFFWALLVSGQINMRKVDGWQRSPQSPSISQLTSPPDLVISNTNRNGTQAVDDFDISH